MSIFQTALFSTEMCQALLSNKPVFSKIIYFMSELQRAIYSQAFIIRVMQRMGYKTTDKGTCYGYQQMAIHALLVDDIETFHKRIDLIRGTPTLELQQKILAVEALKRNQQELTEEQLLIDSLHPFFNGIELFQHPSFYQDEWADFVYESASSIVQSEALEKAGGLVKIAEFSRIYSVRSLTTTLEGLREASKQSGSDQTIPVCLHDTNHAIAIAYHPKTDQWSFIDANNPDKRSLRTPDEMAASIIAAFNPKQTATIAFHVFSTKCRQADAETVTTNWFGQEDFKTLHTPNQQTAVAKDHKNCSWLLLACQVKNNSYNDPIELVRNLLELGANPNIKCERDYTPLRHACRNGSNEIVELLLANGALVNDVLLNDNSRSPLYLAIHFKHPAIVKTLLAHGANIEDAGASYLSTLDKAAEVGVNEIMAEILTKPFNTNELVQALNIAYKKGHQAVVKLLTDKITQQPDGLKALTLFTAQHGQPDALATLLNQLGEGLNASLDENDSTAILVAAEQGNLGVVADLINQGALFNSRSGSKQITPLFAAAQNGHQAVLDHLLAQYAATDTPLTTTVDKLPALTADASDAIKHRMALFINMHQAQGHTDIAITPYQMACIMGHTTIIETLSREKGAPAPDKASLDALLAYSETRQKDSREYYFPALLFGNQTAHSKAAKIQAATDLHFIYYCFGTLHEQIIPTAATNGELGKLVDGLFTHKNSNRY